MSEPTAPTGAAGPNPPPYPPRKLTTVFWIGFIFGPFGAHRFYTGHMIPGLIQLATCGGCLIWVSLDMIEIMAGRFKDAWGRPLDAGAEKSDTPAPSTPIEKKS